MIGAGFLVCAGSRVPETVPRILVAAGILAILCGVLPAAAAPLDETWSATFGGSLMENGYSVTPSGDGGYVIAGDARSSESVVSSDGWAIGTSSGGARLWDRRFGGSRYDSLNSVAAVSGGYVFAGTTLSFPSAGGQEAWLIRTGPDGTELWNRTYGSPGTDLFQAVIQTTDGGYAAAGLTSAAGNGDAYLVKTSADGTEEWHASFGGTKSDKAMSLHQLSDGGYILAGTTYSMGENESNLYLVRTDSTGHLLWQKTYGHNRLNFGYDVDVLPDGGFAAVGYTDPYPSAGNRSVLAVRTASDGSVVWETTPGSLRLISEGRSVAALDDGSLVITGGSQGLYLLGLAPGGTTVWETVIARSPNDWGMDIRPVAGSSGFVIGGLREQPGNNWDVYLVRADPVPGPQEPVILPGMTNPPTDPDGDGLYEDLNGNGRTDFADVSLFFAHMEWIAENEPVPLFDLNGNDRIDFNDIVKQFEEF